MTAPVFAIVAAHLVFEERFRVTQWFGVWIMLSGIFGLAIYNIRLLKTNRDTLPVAMIFATATVVFTAIYTAYDAWASARRLTILFLWYGFLFLTDSVYRRWCFANGSGCPIASLLCLSCCAVLLAGLLEF